MYEMYKKLDELIEYLKATDEQKYVSFSNYLYEISDLDYKAEGLYYDKTWLARGGADIIKTGTSYSEYKKISRRLTKVSYQKQRKLNKFKQIRKFINNDLENVLYDLHRTGLTIESDPLELKSFFDNCVELDFLNKGKVSRKLK